MATNNALLATMRKSLECPVFYFPLDYRLGGNLPLPHLTGIKQAEQEFNAALAFNLHSGQTNEAFENLIAAITLPRVFKDEPVIISQLVRYADISMAFEATWAALQYDGWPDVQLASLQSEWNKIEIVPQALPAMAMERTTWPKVFELGRESFPLECMCEHSTNRFTEFWEIVGGGDWKEFLDRYPHYWHWIWTGSYDDERQIMKNLQDGINVVKTGYYKKLEDSSDFYKNFDESAFLVSLREWSAIEHFVQKTFRTMTQTQMAMTAIALKRYHQREGKYPASLLELIPAYLKIVPVDYMDGRTLRYRLKTDGTFLLYSVGENGTDEGGNPKVPASKTLNYLNGLDWVWPQAATREEIDAVEKAEAERWRKITSGYHRSAPAATGK